MTFGETRQATGKRKGERKDPALSGFPSATTPRSLPCMLAAQVREGVCVCAAADRVGSVMPWPGWSVGARAQPAGEGGIRNHQPWPRLASSGGEQPKKKKKNPGRAGPSIPSKGRQTEVFFSPFSLFVSFCFFTCILFLFLFF
ncbi:hypothetical protein LX36DRAFT_280976 [Colletotrichum falcatum]|nr:hypothetical protein LX36DRAFT_280976 [Colletotrichum falcatum]